MKSNILIFLLLLSLSVNAQETYYISGTVRDAKGISLPGATVFLTNTKHIAASDNNGKFSFTNLESGTFELVIKMIGFKAYVEKITVNSKPIIINAVLKEDNVLLNEVKISVADPNRPKYIALFTKYFIGESTNASQCKILNPEALHFHYEKNADILEASTEKLLTIENRGLGYRLNYLVTDFKFDKKNLTLTYTGYPYFEDLKGTAAQQKRWEANRKTAYAGSMAHFFRSAFSNTAKAEGFIVYALSDKVAKMKLDSVPSTAAADLFSPAGDNYKLLKPDYNDRSAGDTTALFVFYKGGTEPYTYQKSGLYVLSPVKLPGKGRLSKLEPLIPGIMIDKNGGVNPQQGFLTSGFWAWTKVSELVPLDYHLDQPLEQTAPKSVSTTPDSKLNETVKRLASYVAINPTEKIYLQLNKPWYGRGDTIWLKAYTVSGDQHQLSNLSHVAYAELVNPNDSIIQKLNLKLESGMASGDFTLPLTLTPGVYRIRAYTNWMRNQGEQYFFDRQLQIGSPLSPEVTTTAVKKKDNRATIAAAAATVAVNNKPDVQFFPESGTLTSGLRNVIAFKATSPDGSGANLSVTIVNRKGEVQADAVSGYNGMGSFALTPTEGESYIAKLQFNNGTNQTVNLPKAAAQGYTLTVNNFQPDTLLVKIAVNTNLLKSEKGAGFFLVIQSGGTIYYTTSGKLNELGKSIKIAKEGFPTGVTRLTLFSAAGEPLNERVVFIQQPDKLKLKASSLKNTFAEGEQVSIDLNAITNLNQPVIGSFSAAVINESKVPVDEMAEPTIFSQLLLSSEIHGQIQNPGYYLADQDPKRVADLDLLMLTQGFRKLEWKKLLDTTKKQPDYLAEDGLRVSGMVNILGGKKISKSKVSFISPQLLLKADTVTDMDGHFALTGINIQDKASVILKAENLKNYDVKLTLDPQELKASSRTINLNAPKDTSNGQLMQALTNSYQQEEQQYQKAKGNLLKEVTIKERYDPTKLRAEQFAGSTNRNGPGNADQVITGKDLESMGCGSLMECLIARLSRVSPGQEGLYDMSRGSNVRLNGQTGTVGLISMGEPMKIFVDGTQGSAFDIAGNIAGITPYDIQSIEVLTSAKYKALYGHDAASGLILITTKKGIPKYDRLPKEKVPNILNYTFNGFYKARSFYIPKYEANNTADQQRSAIYWQPDLLTDKDGKAGLQFINAGKGTYRVIVEGVDGDGRLGRVVYRYKVE